MSATISRLALLSLCVAAAPAVAEDADSPHKHQGVLTPYAGAPPQIALSADDQAVLESGEPVFKKTEGKRGGRGVAVFRVNASPAVVWSVIKDFDRYTKWIKNVDEIEVYKRTSSVMDVRFKVSAMGMGIGYFIHHTYSDKTRVMTWTLDYSRESDLDDSVGYWRIDPVPGQPDVSTVTYSVDIKVSGWVPGFIRTMLVDNGLKTATGWLRPASERRQAAWKKRQQRVEPPPATITK
jgi:carbon monoxide dehydrogenase subunit G